MTPIDAVVTWVDGDDPVLRRKRSGYITGRQEDSFDDIAGSTRYTSSGEIFLCVASILKFAPFIRRIFIITDGQDPHIGRLISGYFPDCGVSVRIVDHKEIFRGYGQYLPTFNSLSIETMMYRIPGLSEHFVYFNDDFMLLRPLEESDLVSDGRPVVYGYWHFTFTAWLCRLLGRLKKHSEFKFRDSMLNAATTLGGKALFRFIRTSHTPQVLRKSVCERFYAGHPEALVSNIRHKFRDKSQFNPQTLFHTMMLYSGDCVLRSEKDALVYIGPRAEWKSKTRRMIDRLKGSRTAKFCCINSLDKASPDQKAEILEYLSGKIGIPFGTEFEGNF